MTQQRGHHQLLTTTLVITTLLVEIAHGIDTRPSSSNPEIVTVSCSGGVDGQQCIPAGVDSSHGHGRLSETLNRAWDWLWKPAAGVTLGATGDAHSDVDASLPADVTGSSDHVTRHDTPTDKKAKIEVPGPYEAHLAAHLRRVVEQTVLSISGGVANGAGAHDTEQSPDIDSDWVSVRSTEDASAAAAAAASMAAPPTTIHPRPYSAWDWLRDPSPPAPSSLDTDTATSCDTNRERSLAEEGLATSAAVASPALAAGPTEETQSGHAAPFETVAVFDQPARAEAAMHSGAARRIAAQDGGVGVDEAQEIDVHQQQPKSPASASAAVISPAISSAPLFAAVDGLPLAAAAAAAGALVGVALGMKLGASMTRRAAGRAWVASPPGLVDAATQTDTEQEATLYTRPAPPNYQQQKHPQQKQQDQRPEHWRQVPEPASSQVSLRGPHLPSRDAVEHKSSSRRRPHKKQVPGHAAGEVGFGADAASSLSGVDLHAGGGCTVAADVAATATSGVGANAGIDDNAAETLTDTVGVTVSERAGHGCGGRGPAGGLYSQEPKRSSGSSCSSCSGGGADDRDASVSDEVSSSLSCSVAPVPSAAMTAVVAVAAAQACGLTPAARRGAAARNGGGVVSGLSGAGAMQGSEGCRSSTASPMAAAAASMTSLTEAARVVDDNDNDAGISVSVATAMVEIAPEPAAPPPGPHQFQQQQQYQFALAKLQVQALAQLQALSLLQQQHQMAQHGLGLPGFMPPATVGLQWGGGTADGARSPLNGGAQSSASAAGAMSAVGPPRWPSGGGGGGSGGGSVLPGGFGTALLPAWPGMAESFGGGPYGGAGGPYSMYEGAVVAGSGYANHPNQAPQRHPPQLQAPAASTATVGGGTLVAGVAVGGSGDGGAIVPAGGGAGGVGGDGGGGQLMVPAAEAHSAMVAMTNRLMDAFNMRMAEVSAVITDASFAVRELSGDVREGAGLLRHVIGGWELEAQRGMVAAAMQRGMVVMWVTLVGASVRMGRWRAVAWTCSQDRPARDPEFAAALSSASASGAASRSLGWWSLRAAGWTLGLAGRSPAGTGGAGGSAGAAGGWGLGWAWERLLGSLGSRLLPAWLRVVACYCHELGLFTVGLVFVFYLLRPLLRNTLSVDLRHSWAVDVPLLLGGLWGAVGCQVVSSLGGRWTVWLAGWWAWCAAGGALHARRLRGGGWAQAAALAALTVAVPAVVAVAPFMELAQPVHEAMEGWWRAAAAAAAAWLGMAEEGDIAPV